MTIILGRLHEECFPLIYTVYPYKGNQRLQYIKTHFVTIQHHQQNHLNKPKLYVKLLHDYKHGNKHQKKIKTA